jgi:outer membrane receptor protein involved in Fe transport
LEPASESDDVLEMSLEELLDVEVTVATRTRIRLSASPSTVSVITSDEIRRRQYRSIAEALRTVPGLYDVNDLVLHNVGIRGVSGGLRAGGSLLKLMIDGMPVSFAPTTGNFFGPELVPIELVERIEVIRGPASALYGSNAFLGVVNVVTRTASELPTATLYAAGGAIRNQPTATGGVILARAFGPVSLLLSVEASRTDRSRLSLPPSSPILDSSSIGFAPNARSLDDLARPLTFFGRLEIDEVGPGRLELMSSVQRLDSIAELSDVEPMTHRSRTVLGSQTLRLGYVFNPIDTRRRPGSVELRFDVAYFRSSPGNQDRINLGSVREDELRRVRTHGVLVSAELHASPLDDLSLVAVADVRVEHHRLQHYDRLVLEDVFGADGSVQIPAGSILPGSVYGDGEATFVNVGFQGQLEYSLNAAWRFTAGARVDVHSVYGAEVSPRLAIVLAPEDERYHLKLMFGSSFKAPSAEQLYTSPVRTFDIEGNPNLDEQTARTIELASGYELGEIGTFAVTGFATQIRGRVEYLQEGLFLSAQNSLDEWYAGAEVELRLVPYAGVDIQLALAHARLVGRRGDERRVVIPAAEVDQPLYPELQLHLQTSYESRVRTHPGGYIRFSYVGARAASEQNAALAGAPYALPAYVIVDLAATMRERFFGVRETRIGIEVENLFDERFVDPGFGGVDLPSLGRSFFLTFAQEL